MVESNRAPVMLQSSCALELTKVFILECEIRGTQSLLNMFKESLATNTMHYLTDT